MDLFMNDTIKQKGHSPGLPLNMFTLGNIYIFLLRRNKIQYTVSQNTVHGVTKFMLL